MRVARPARHRIEAAAGSLLLCLIVLAWAPAFCSPSTAPARFREISASPKPTVAGIYKGHAPAEDAAKRSFTLKLSPDGSALLTTIYIGKLPATESGRWSQEGEDLVLTFDPLGSNQPPRPITFRYHREALHPVHWDLSEWGSAGPPVLNRDPHDATLASP
jgi:NlpE N-terminal domain